MALSDVVHTWREEEEEEERESGFCRAQQEGFAMGATVTFFFMSWFY